MKKIFTIIILIGLSGCVSIEMPDNLVSDTVVASKDAYHSIKNKISKKDSPQVNRTFSHRYTMQEGESVGESTANCVNGAVETARQTLNVYNIEVENTTTNLVSEEGKSILECTVVITD